MHLAALEGVLVGLHMGDLDQVLARRVHGIDRLGLRRGAPGQFVEQLVVEVHIDRIEVDAVRLRHQLVPQRRLSQVIGLRLGGLCGRVAHGDGKAVEVDGLQQQNDRQQHGDGAGARLVQHDKGSEHHAVADRPQEAAGRAQDSQHILGRRRQVEEQDGLAEGLDAVGQGEGGQDDERKDQRLERAQKGARRLGFRRDDVEDDGRHDQDQQAEAEILIAFECLAGALRPSLEEVREVLGDRIEKRVDAC